MAGHNKALGELGEQIAEEYLRSNRYTIVARNFRSRHSELDIVVRDAFTLRVVEVKSRMAGSESTIEVSLSPKKLDSIRKGIFGFLSTHHDFNRLELFVDLITVVFYPDMSHKIEYVKDFHRF